MEIYSANEYWVKGASLLHTDPAGQGRSARPSDGAPLSHLQPPARHGNRHQGHLSAARAIRSNSTPMQRALWEALDQWATKGVAPPPSMVPRLADGTLVAALPQSGARVPEHSGRHLYTGLKTTRYLFELRCGLLQHGNHDDQPAGRSRRRCSTTRRTARSIRPTCRRPMPTATISPAFACRDVTVPLATYTGWALRAGAHAGDGCEGAGQMIPFAKTKAERLASGDPRPVHRGALSVAVGVRREGQGRGRRSRGQAPDASRRRAASGRPHGQDGCRETRAMKIDARTN